jgi:hypothetical protein
LAGVFVWLPTYTKQFSAADVVRTVPDQPDAPVVSCGADWDSVGFYLNRDGVTVVSSKTADELTRQLVGAERAVLFVRNDADGRAVVADLPAEWHCRPTGENRLLCAFVLTRDKK